MRVGVTALFVALLAGLIWLDGRAQTTDPLVSRPEHYAAYCPGKAAGRSGQAGI